MKKNRKLTVTVAAFLIGLSLFSSIPIGSAAMETILGHTFEEEYWSVVCDSAGTHLVSDFGPTGSSSSAITTGLTDANPVIDNNYFGAYTNVGGVKSLYLAMQNFSWDITGGVKNTTLYGCSPYQVLVQHFQPPNEPKKHFVVINTFLGLMAYQDNLTDGLSGLPDENDTLYMGWSYRSEFHKFLANVVFLANGMPEWMFFDNTTRTTAVPIPCEKVGTTYRYGMSYKDVFILWQKIGGSEIDGAVTGAQVLEGVSAFAMLDELNFTFVVDYKLSTENPEYGEVTTSTEYDIGQMSELWIVGDNESVATEFGGVNFDLSTPDIDLAYYNSSDVSTRLTGNSTTPGYGLAVVNTAKVYGFELVNTFLGELPVTLPHSNFTDSSNDTLGVGMETITESEFNSSGNPAYKIDFAGKPNYTLNGVDEYAAPTRVLRNEAVNINPGPGIFERVFLGTLISMFVGNITGNWLAGVASGFQIFLVDFYYATCFPEWSGGTINQDPTFTAFVAPPSSNNLIWVIAGAGIIGLAAIVLILRRRRK